MQAAPASPTARLRWTSPALLLGWAAVAAARLLTLPHSLWEGDEVLFIRGIEHFDPLHHRPHPPGYPLLIGLGKLLDLLVHDPFTSLVALSVISSLVAYGALVDAFRRIVSPASGPEAAERIGVAGALLFLLSPAMLVYGPMALSDPPALMFLALALAAAARLSESPTLGSPVALGAFASAAVGCRPQLALAVLPMLAVALWPARREGRRIAAALGAFTLVSLLWFVPLLAAVGGPSGLLAFLGKQAGLVAEYDAVAPRAGRGGLWVATRFLAHPWGPRWTSLPVLALASAGAVALAASRRVRRARVLPLAVLCGVDLGFCLLVMNPQDAVRYALPSLLGIAFAAAVGCHVVARRARVPRAVWPAAALLAAGFAIYTWPLLAARSRGDSPPVQAARWIQRSVPHNAVLLVDRELAPQASWLLRDYVLLAADPGLQTAALHNPGTPVFLLGDGESAWPGAQTFQWPGSDAWGKLMRGHFRVVSVSSIPPERRYEVVRGVEDYEASILEPAWRWLGPDALVRIDLRGVRTRLLAVTLGLPGQAPYPVVPVTLAVNGTPLAALRVARNGRQEILLPLPAGAEAAEVSFRSGSSFVPAASGLGSDTRRLSVQLLALEQRGF
jgi:hypothetical protein